MTMATLIGFAVASLLAACNGDLTSPGTIRGSGWIVTEDRPVSDFSAVSLVGSGRVFIEQDGTESLTITADDNILPVLTSDVEDGRLTLSVERDRSISPSRDIVYRLTVKDLTVIEITGSGDVSATDIETAFLLARIVGAGDITPVGTADRQEVDIAGSGNYFGQDFESRVATVDIAGSGSVVANVSDSLDVSIAGSGLVEYIGDPELTISIAGSGMVRKR